MKAIHSLKISAAAITACALVSSAAHSQTVAPPGLTGVISARVAVVKSGDPAYLDWKVNCPSEVKKVVTITKDKITTLEKVYADVRVIGQGVTGSSPNGGYFFAPTKATMSISSLSDFKTIFFGINPDVNAAKIIQLPNFFDNNYKSNIVQAGKAIRFGGQYVLNGYSGTHFKSSDGTNNVRFLVHGDKPPSNIPEYNAPSLESFLRPYLDTSGNVKIGPMDVIVFMELTHTAAQITQPGYDLQDMVLLVTFTKVATSITTTTTTTIPSP